MRRMNHSHFNPGHLFARWINMSRRVEQVAPTCFPLSAAFRVADAKRRA